MEQGRVEVVPANDGKAERLRRRQSQRAGVSGAVRALLHVLHQIGLLLRTVRHLNALDAVDAAQFQPLWRIALGRHRMRHRRRERTEQDGQQGDPGDKYATVQDGRHAAIVKQYKFSCVYPSSAHRPR